MFQSDYIQLQSAVSSITSWKHSVQAVPSKKKKLQEEKRKEKERKEMEKGVEGEGKETDGKEEKKKRGWRKFVRKERENEE